MTITTLSSRVFNQDTGRVKKATKDGPVFITDRGRPALVVMTIEEYRRITGKGMTLAEALAQHGDEADFDFEPPQLEGPLFNRIEFD